MFRTRPGYGYLGTGKPLAPSAWLLIDPYTKEDRRGADQLGGRLVHSLGEVCTRTAGVVGHVVI